MKRKTDIIITILGSGTCVPSLERSSCALLVETGTAKILCDCGPGTIRRLLEANIDPFDITYLLISHFHPDHTGELVSFLFSNKYGDGGKRKKKLTVVSGKGFNSFFNGLKNVYGEWIDLGEFLSITELDIKKRDSYETSDFSVESIPVNHNRESVAFRINTSGKCVVYSGDTDVCEGLAELAKDADVFICESALPEAKKSNGHLTPALAGEIAAKASVKTLCLTHFYPECDNYDIAKECRQSFGGQIILARDLMKIKV